MGHRVGVGKILVDGRYTSTLMPEEAISTGKVRLLGMTGRVENVPLSPSLTQSRPWRAAANSSFDHIKGRRGEKRVMHWGGFVGATSP